MSLFLQEGGGSSLDQLVIIYVVIIGLRREGAKPNLQVVTKYAGFFLKAPLSTFLPGKLMPNAPQNVQLTPQGGALFGPRVLPDFLLGSVTSVNCRGRFQAF